MKHLAIAFAIIIAASANGQWTVINLHPAGATESYAYGVDGSQQVGFAVFGFIWHASLWTGTAASWIDLNPAGSTASEAYGVGGGQQVGLAIVRNRYLASLWSGTAASWVDLSAFLPGVFTESFARGIWSDASFTYVAGYGYNQATNRREALLWVSRAVAPISFSMFRGTAVSGNLGSLLVSDDNRLVMIPGIVFSSSEPPIQVILNGTAPSSAPAGFSFSLESSASFGSAQQKIWLFNYATDLYEELDSRFATIADNTLTVTVSGNTSNYIQAGTLAIKARVSYKALGLSFAYPWQGRIDKAWWNFPG